MPHLYSQPDCHIYILLYGLSTTAIFLVPVFFKWGQKQLSSQLCILQKLFLFGHTTAFSRTFFCLRFRFFQPRFGVERFPSFHPCFAPFRDFAFLPAMTSDDTL